MKLRIFLGFTILAATGHAQIVPGSTGHGQPTFNCAMNDTYKDIDTGLVWQCVNPPTGWIPTPQFMPWGGSSSGTVKSPSLISLVQPVYNVLGYGAVGNGTHDDTAAIQAAVTACQTGQGILYFPRTSGAFTTTQHIAISGQCDVGVDGTVRATAAMDAVFYINGGSQLQFFGSGTIDTGNLAARNIWLYRFSWYTVTGVTLWNSASVASLDLGGAGSPAANGAVVHDINIWVPVGVTNTAGSVGIWLDTAFDSTIGPKIQIVGQDISARDSTGGNQAWSGIHAWGQVPNGSYVGNMPSTCFDSVQGNAHWIDMECDTPTAIGIHAHGFNDAIDHYRCFNNSFGTDNVVNCIQFDQTNPIASIMNSVFKGQTSSSRIAADIVAPGNNFSTITTLGNQVMGNVVTTNSLNSVVAVPSGSTFSVIGGTANLNNGTRIGFSGTFINFMWKGSGTLTYASITAPGCQEQPLTITNALSGDVCHASTGATDIGSGFSYAGCRVSAANTAQIKVCATATGTPTAVTWTAWATH